MALAGVGGAQGGGQESAHESSAEGAHGGEQGKDRSADLRDLLQERSCEFRIESHVQQEHIHALHGKGPFKGKHLASIIYIS